MAAFILNNFDLADSANDLTRVTSVMATSGKNALCRRGEKYIVWMYSTKQKAGENRAGRNRGRVYATSARDEDGWDTKPKQTG